MLLILISVSAVLFLILWIVLIVYSPGIPEPFVNKEGIKIKDSISEKIFVQIGGTRQGMFIRSKNIGNPVLLYVHGGPAFPNYFLVEKYKPGLEDHFTVCYWEQRGGGLSYNRNISPQSMTFEQLTSDAIEVTNYLRMRFGKEKIYIMAHSGGTPIAINAVAKEPRLYRAYVGMAQITLQFESEKVAFKIITEKYAALGNLKAARELKKYRDTETVDGMVAFFKSPFRDKAMHELGMGTMRNMKSVIKGVFIPVWFCKAYTIKEKINIWVSKLNFLPKTRLTDELLKMDIPERIPKLEIPVYFFSGKYDFTVNVDLSKAYFEKLQAPVKGFYCFENSAHSPLFEEPEKVKRILVNDILTGTNTLSVN